MQKDSDLLAARRVVRQARQGQTPTFDFDALGDEARDQLVQALPHWVAHQKGWLYLAANPSWPGAYKVGCTRKGVPQRMQSLASAGLLTPWAPEVIWSVYDAHGLEAACHRACAPWPRQGEIFEAPRAELERAIRETLLADKRLLLTHLASLLLPGALHELLAIEQICRPTASCGSDSLLPIQEQVKPQTGGSHDS